MQFATAASLFFSVALAQGDWSAPLSKPAIHPNLDFIEDGLQRYLPEISFTLNKWNDNRIPQECKTRVGNANDFDIYEMHYDDCAEPWLLCHNRNAPVSPDTIARQFSKVPIGMRQWVRLLIDVPAGSTSAYNAGGTIYINNANGRMISVLVHETAHSTNMGGFPGDNFQSLWDGYQQDQGVPDNYAKSNMIENLAQVTVVSVFDENVPGGIQAVDPNWWKMQNQLRAMQKYGRLGGSTTTLHVPGQDKACVHHVSVGAITTK
ncbi:hypothetical protein LMH87_001051 [Akanthomyces muscarius]|uniref:Conidiation-specific protein n=1 Tax=Akanthomyces muscarius TaxID=2231603 RepID=A0A9W8UPB1_AKAMU|nr:hypothetical protein LMH87_001051 [Akanthomyces muscarius]KAJ4155824.1 hypothetical protein LMH87_001051 [Akanthomyces muscarius]